MNLCNHGHEEICYEGRYCPLCDTITDKEKEISNREQEIRKLEAIIDRLESEEPA